MPSLECRIAGGLLGIHAGDCLGATREFGPPDRARSHREIAGGGPFGWQPGEPTDDTGLTACVLRAYPEPTFSLGTVADNMVRWLQSGPKDVGGATARGLRRYQQTQNPRQAGAGAGSLGNGSLMRCLPTALARRDAGTVVEESRAISAITHDDPVCQDACACYNMIASEILKGVAPEAALRSGQVVAGQEVGEALELAGALKIDELADRGDPGVRWGNRGHVLDSLTLAIAAFRDERQVESVLVDQVALGGDADSTAAIAGGLLESVTVWPRFPSGGSVDSGCGRSSALRRGTWHRPSGPGPVEARARLSEVMTLSIWTEVSGS